MGFGISKSVKVEMTTKKCLARRQERFRQKHKLKRLRLKKLLQEREAARLGNKNHWSKKPLSNIVPSSGGRASAEEISSLSSVQVADGESDYRDLGYTAGFYKTPRWAIQKLVEKFNKEFEDVDLDTLENEKDEELRKKRKFVIAWRAALSNFSHEKLDRAKWTGIPVAATSFCQQGISRWKRCHRFCLRCSSAATAEHFLEDLLHKDSLDRFMYEEEEHQLTSQVVIKQDLKRAKLFDSVTHPDEARGEEADGVDVDEEDLTVEVRFHVPIPVHIEHPPMDLIHLPTPEKMHHVYEEHQHQLHDILEHHNVSRKGSKHEKEHGHGHTHEQTHHHQQHHGDDDHHQPHGHHNENHQHDQHQHHHHHDHHQDHDHDHRTIKQQHHDDHHHHPINQQQRQHDDDHHLPVQQQHPHDNHPRPPTQQHPHPPPPLIQAYDAHPHLNPNQQHPPLVHHDHLPHPIQQQHHDYHTFQVQPHHPQQQQQQLQQPQEGHQGQGHPHEEHTHHPRDHHTLHLHTLVDKLHHIKINSEHNPNPDQKPKDKEKENK